MKDFRSPELYTVVLYQPDKKQWLSFEKPSEILSTLHPSDILPVLNEVEHRCRDGRYAAGFVSYEAATCFESAIPVCENYKFPLLWFGIYDKPVIYSKPETSSINQPLTWNSSISETEYVLLINKIKDYIRHGDTYQVNFSFDLITGFNSDLFDFFNYLSDIHPSPYSAYINLDNFSIASFSPELFFSLKEGTITCRPMKGTIKRGKTCIEDTRNSQMLFNSAKNRAENIMIVDMIRNDLGRIAKTGTVRVEELFQIEKYKTIFQMTSTISAQTDKSIVEIFKALFPCASITGAPKIRTSQIINELEDRPRGIYCGSIGYITPQKDVQFNVAIRTITLDKLNNSATYNVGSGIVWDSDPLDEYRECLAKAHILHSYNSGFDLLESILYEPGTGYFLLEEHISRCIESARYFDFDIKEETLRYYLAEISSSFGSKPIKIRITIDKNGNFRHTVSEITTQPAVITVNLSTIAVNSSDTFLYHKTTNREIYDKALKKASKCSDVILWNENNELTEMTTGNLVLEMDGKLLTPRSECGLLCGTFRSHLVKNGTIIETIITKDDLLKCTRIFRINSVRKWQQCELL